MRFYKTLSLLFAACCIVSCSKKVSDADFNIVPLPQSVVNADGTPFELSNATAITYPAGDTALARQAEMLAQYIAEQSRITVRQGSGSNTIVLRSNLDTENPEAYRLTVDKDSIIINGATPAGTFYGMQTLRKAIGSSDAEVINIPAVTVNDAPRFAYRGMHLDVVRHFFPIDSVKEYIDMLALHNVNKLHWHLTDDQGWRIEIKSRSKLTEIGSKRPATEGTASNMLFDSIPQDGYYTHEELRDVLRYAADRYIDIIPEVDMPGHMQAALASYPELGCTGGPYKVTDCWTVGENVLCLGNEETYKFLEDVFAELIDIFPYELIHIGGDECTRDIWKNCKACQKKADELGLKDDKHGTREAKLQNYVMHHIADYLKEHGRRVIGWDEVLDSDFAQDAIVMSWRGEEGGIAGARLGNDVIMTPSSHLYFDYYQSPDIDTEPIAIGGYIPVEKVYSYEPVPECLSDDEKKHILGAQANVWTEYIPTFKQVQYMTLPRMAALSEVQWTNPEKKDFSDFANRVARLTELYSNKGWRFCDHILNVKEKFETDAANNSVLYTLSTYDNAPIHYTTDGTTPTLDSPIADKPISLSESGTIQAAAERNGKLGRLYSTEAKFSKATLCPVELTPAPDKSYTFEGASKLTDGRTGSGGYYDNLWLGFVTPEITATIDLGEPTTISKVRTNSNVYTIAWIFGARKMTVEVSTDGKTFTEVAGAEYPVIEEETQEIVNHVFDFEPTEARYVRLNITTENKMPEWHPGKGRQAYFFIDEILVD